MGAFILVANDERDFNLQNALNTIKEQCNTDYKHFALPGYNLWLFPKKNSNNNNYSIQNKQSLFITGTAYIPGKPMQALFEEHDPLKTITGIFFLLMQKGTELSFSTDQLGLYSFYHNDSGTVISNSFLAICRGLPRLTLNRDAVVENLLTGSVIGPETTFTEVSRFEVSEPFRFNNLTFIPADNNVSYNNLPDNREESIRYQMQVLNEWFEGIKPVAEETGVSAGITGGLDSRLLMALCLKYFSNAKLQLFSHLRKIPGPDYQCGKELCRISGADFNAAPVSDIADLNPEQQNRMLYDGMMFNDGQVRTHSFWFEEFNTFEYLQKIAGKNRLLFNGIGGEQYRNMERMILPSWSKMNWIRFDLIAKLSGTKSTNKITGKHLTENLANKIAKKIGPPENNRVTLLYIKRYLNEVYNPSNRALRSCHENRQLFSLPPFALTPISLHAYKSVRHLGPSLGFEAEMIKRTDALIASVNSAYGYNFNHREPVTGYLPRIVFNNLLPTRLKMAWLTRSGTGAGNRWEELYENNETFSELADILTEVNLPVNTGALMKRTDAGPLIFAMGFLLKEFGDKLTN